MKKIKRLLLMLVCILALTACGKEDVAEEGSYYIYYVSSSETKIESRDYVLQADTLEEQLEELLECLSVVPEKLEYKAPLSMGFELLDAEMESGRVMLDVDKAYQSMPATTEVLVRAALVNTLTQLEGINYVSITVEGQPLCDATGSLVGWMNAEHFIYNDGNEINTYELTRVKLYFANENGDKLIAAFREKHYSTNTPLERFIVEELILGPSGQIPGLYPTINPATKVINVMTKDGICYVNLDASFLTVQNNVPTEVAVYSIVNSLVELSNINKVQILINGEVPANFTTSTFERNLDYVVTLEQGGN